MPKKPVRPASRSGAYGPAKRSGATDSSYGPGGQRNPGRSGAFERSPGASGAFRPAGPPKRPKGAPKNIRTELTDLPSKKELEALKKAPAPQPKGPTVSFAHDAPSVGPPAKAMTPVSLRPNTRGPNTDGGGGVASPVVVIGVVISLAGLAGMVLVAGALVLLYTATRPEAPVDSGPEPLKAPVHHYE